MPDPSMATFPCGRAASASENQATKTETSGVEKVRWERLPEQALPFFRRLARISLKYPFSLCFPLR